MKKIGKNKIKNIAISTASSLVLVAPMCLNSVAYATNNEVVSSGNGVNVRNVKDLGGNNSSMTIDFIEANESVNMSINQINENLIEVKTMTSNGESHHFTYDKTENIARMDGEQIGFSLESFVEEELVKESKNAKSAWDPVYVSSYRLNMDSKIANSLGVICTIIGGAIAVASLAGVSIAASAIATSVSNWSGAVGLGSLAGGYLFSGTLTYKLYRTKSPVQPPMGVVQTGYRFQDIRSTGNCKGKAMNILLKSFGSWWYGVKP